MNNYALTYLLLGGIAYIVILSDKGYGTPGTDSISYDTIYGLIINGAYLGTAFLPLTIDGTDYPYTDTAGITAAILAIVSAGGQHVITFRSIDGAPPITFTLNL